jgi:hypothetical protein
MLHSSKEYFDYVIIDEGQDLLNEYHIDAIGRLLKGGFESGDWAMFMDKDYQIYTTAMSKKYSHISGIFIPASCMCFNLIVETPYQLLKELRNKLVFRNALPKD